MSEDSLLKIGGSNRYPQQGGSTWPGSNFIDVGQKLIASSKGNARCIVCIARCVSAAVADSACSCCRVCFGILSCCRFRWEALAADPECSSGKAAGHVAGAAGAHVIWHSCVFVACFPHVWETRSKHCTIHVLTPLPARRLTLEALHPKSGLTPLPARHPRDSSVIPGVLRFRMLLSCYV